MTATPNVKRDLSSVFHAGHADSETKRCTRCGETKLARHFNVRSDTGTLYSWCRSCASAHNSRMRNWYRRAA